MGYSGLGYKYRFSSGEREKIEGVLAWKWGIQSHLHVDHIPIEMYNQHPTPVLTLQTVLCLVVPQKSPESFDVGATPQKSAPFMLLTQLRIR